MSLPRVLYVGAHPIGYPNATGQTMAALYAGQDDSGLTQFVYLGNQGQPVGTVVPIPATVAPLGTLLRTPYLAMRRAVTGMVIDGMNGSIPNPSITRQGRLVRDLKVLADLSPVVIPRRVLSELRAREPEVIHSLLGSGRILRLALAISRELDIPVLPHFMDDWPRLLYSGGAFGGRATVGVSKLVSGILGRSDLLLTIGDDMAAEYRARYDRPTVVVGNSVNPEDYRDVALDIAQALTYVGGLHLGRAEVICGVARSLHAAGSRVSVRVFAPEWDSPRVRSLPGADLVTWNRPVSLDQVPHVLMQSEALLFVESTVPAVADYTRLSVSTKVPQYLAARRPIVLAGPPEQASVATLMRHAGERTFLLRGSGDHDGGELETFLARSGGTSTAILPDSFSEVSMRNAFVEAARQVIREWRQRT